MKSIALSRLQLRELRAELELELSRLERSIGSDAPENRYTESFTTSLESDAGLGVATLTRAHARHDAILDALQRIDDGSYGECSSCRSGIPFGRLQVMPETLYCVACGARA